ncbi:MAG: glycerophosphodiester phosphodiesterase family protein [Pseudomonadota bacterium]
MHWNHGFSIIGHRGAAGLAPENTLASFRAALAHRAAAVECDLYLVDGELLVIHDDKLDRTTNGTGRVASTPLNRIRALDAGGGEPPPLIAEVLQTLPTTVALNIELKGPQTAGPTARLIARLQPRQAVLVSSFDHDELRAFRALDEITPVGPLYHRGVSTTGMIQTARELQAATINLADRLATAQRIGEIRAEGFGVLVYTINSPERAAELRSLGATGVFTDRPDIVLA